MNGRRSVAISACTCLGSVTWMISYWLTAGSLLIAGGKAFRDRDCVNYRQFEASLMMLAGLYCQSNEVSTKGAMD